MVGKNQVKDHELYLGTTCQISYKTHLLFSCSVMSDSLQAHGLQNARFPCPSPSPGACSNSRPLSQWCHLNISSSVVPFSCLQSFPVSGSFPMSQLFASSDQSIGASASASVPPMNTQHWFPLGLTGLISLQSKGLSRVFYNTTVQKHQHFSTQAFFMVQLSHSQNTVEAKIHFALEQCGTLYYTSLLCFILEMSNSLNWTLMPFTSPN